MSREDEWNNEGGLMVRWDIKIMAKLDEKKGRKQQDFIEPFVDMLMISTKLIIDAGWENNCW